MLWAITVTSLVAVPLGRLRTVESHLEWRDVPKFGQAREMAYIKRLSTDTAIVAIAIAAWLCVGIAAPWQDVTSDASSAVVAVVGIWGWSLWTAAVIALLVPSPISATTVHAISPLAVFCAALAVDPLALFGALVAFIVLHSPVVVDRMVQGGAYGKEQRFALRTPVPYMVPAVIAWLVLIGTVVGGSVLLAAQQWWWGVPIFALGVIALINIPHRLHRLSRRWLVLVPAGVVIHDHLVLAETIMTPRNKIASLALVGPESESADFTGGVLGPRIAIELRQADKIVLSKITAKTLGTTEALHVQAYSVAPRRIGAALAALNA